MISIQEPSELPFEPRYNRYNSFPIRILTQPNAKVRRRYHYNVIGLTIHYAKVRNRSQYLRAMELTHTLLTFIAYPINKPKS